MPIDLGEMLSSKNTDANVLDDLQGNILKGHGREHTVNLFLKFDANDRIAARQFVNHIGAKVTSASKQFADVERFKQSNKTIPGDTFFAMFLSFEGYNALGVDVAQIPADDSFRARMRSKSDKLNDPDVTDWDEHFQDEIHAMILIADDAPSKVRAAEKIVTALMPASVKLLGKETGLAMRNPSGDGIEHFGYVDGRSQPLMIEKDVINERDTTDGIHVWNPKFPLRQALVPCPGGTAEVSFGSYFVFRKLEQNVAGFKKYEKEIADVMELPEKEREIVGALLVGRFEDGTPVVLHKQDGADNPVPNNFTYESDPKGVKCPFHAHIRKTNPRGESVGTFAPDLAEERKHIMARRGITYGKRVWENGMKNTKLDEKHLPSQDVGLLFMAYQNNIAEQFEFTQSAWANNEGFVKSATGLDPIIGEGSPSVQLQQSLEWGKENKCSFNFKSFVTMKGGEYFFAPSINFLKTL